MVCGRGVIYGLHKGGIIFGGLGMQVQPDVSSGIFLGSFTEEVTKPGDAIFKGGLKFAFSEERKKFDSSASTDQGEIGEQLEIDRGVSDQTIAGGL